MHAKSPNPLTTILLALALIVSAVCFGIIGFHYRSVETSLTTALKNTEQELLSYKEKTQKLSGALSDSEATNQNLSEKLVDEQEKTFAYGEQVKAIAGIVGDLQEFSKLDPQLLKKYSKVYFLNENYVPEALLPISTTYVYPQNNTEDVHAKVLPFLAPLLHGANNEGIKLRVLSAYRSFGEQAAVKSGYTFIYGAGTANQFSAEQGYSEHQLGTAVDFTTEETGSNFSLFKKSSAYEWLLAHAHEYGFTISYPEGNGYYQFEPWHWRFVGVALAKTLHDQGVYFYNFPQKDIDTYLINIFDPVQ